MTTSKRKKKRAAATNQPEEGQVKQRKQLSTEMRPLKSNAALRTRLRAEEGAAARPLIAANQEQSRFLQLPGEIRVRIYEFALGGNIITPHFVRKTDVSPGRVAHYHAISKALRTFRGVIMSCRAIQAETELVLYSANTFRYCNTKDWGSWFQLLGEKKRAAIRSIQLTNYHVLSHPPATLLDNIPNLKLIRIRVHRRGQGPWDEQAIQDHAQAKKVQMVIEELCCCSPLC